MENSFHLELNIARQQQGLASHSIKVLSDLNFKKNMLELICNQCQTLSLETLLK